MIRYERLSPPSSVAGLALALEVPPSTGARWLIALAAFAAGLVAFVLLAVIEYGAWALVLPPRRPRGGASEPGPENEGIPITAVAEDGVHLAGRFYAATEGAPTCGTVLLLHGFAEAAGTLQAERAPALRKAGWNVAVPDSRGYGESGGPFATFGAREAGDVSAWLHEIQAFTGSERLLVPVLWGRSMGAAIALRAAAEDARIRALVLESPMIDLDAALALWFRNRRFPLPRLLARLVTRRASKLAGVSLTRPAAPDLAPNVCCPVLLLHGEADRLVTVDQARRLASAIAAPTRLIEVPDAGHADVVTIGGEPLLAEVTAFIQAAMPHPRDS
jgi:alpha-beta hydrolase superfamily lysophospholipase